MTATWGLVVATYNRPDILYQCVKLSLEQTRKPKEIIIVDASDGWMESKRRVEDLVIRKETPLIYIKALEKSSAVQRNQGVKRATSDIVFLIDDDSFMLPDFAEHIMTIYDLDVDNLVAGVQGVLTDFSPIEMDTVSARKPVGSREILVRHGISHRIKGWLWENIFLMRAERQFIPYNGRFRNGSVPTNMAHLNVFATNLFEGCRMTLRREVALKEPMESILRAYCPGEDLDACFRASLHGELLTTRDAQLYHHQSALGRLKRHQVALLTMLNQAVMLRRNADDLQKRKRDFNRLKWRRLFAEFFKDVLSQRWNLPQFRGVMSAYRLTPEIFEMPMSELEVVYPRVQEKILKGKALTSVRELGIVCT